jgi:hypothetical protein
VNQYAQCIISKLIQVLFGVVIAIAQEVIILGTNKSKSVSLLLEHIFVKEASEHSLYLNMPKQLSGVPVYFLVIYMPSIDKVSNDYYYDSNY